MNAGRKVKSLSTAICVIGIIISIGLGITMIIVGDGMHYGEGGDTLIVAGIAIGVIGIFLSLVIRLLLYAFGDITENVYAMASIMVRKEMQHKKGVTRNGRTLPAEYNSAKADVDGNKDNL